MSDPLRALKATVTASSTGGVTVTTDAATTEPGHFPLAITKAQPWSLAVKWMDAGTPRDMSAGTATLIARAEAAGSAVVSLTASVSSAGAVFTAGTAATAGYDFVRARYLVAYAEGGTVTALVSGPLDLGNPGLV